MSNTEIQRACTLPLSATVGLFAMLAAAVPGVASAAVSLDSHYFFGTPTGTTVLPPSLPEVSGAGSYTSDDGFATATATFTLAPEASVQLDLTGPTFVGAAFDYSYSISAPGFGPGDFVDGTLTTSMSASGSGAMIAAAALVGTGLTLGHDTGVCFSTLGLCPTTYGSSLTDQTIAVSFASSGTLEIAAAAKVLFGSASVFIDPVITLPEGYVLTLTPGVGNGAPVVLPPVSAVPEPTTVASMGAGLALLALARRRKLRKGHSGQA